MRKIMEKTVPQKGIVKVAFYADDGYTDIIPYSLSLSDDAFFAFRINGEPLPAEQRGFILLI
jgi:DMSO/TMAO reductase YedYZ molybdopterin-dependent catalytic subunit